MPYSSIISVILRKAHLVYGHRTSSIRTHNLNASPDPMEPTLLCVARWNIYIHSIHFSVHVPSHAHRRKAQPFWRPFPYTRFIRDLLCAWDVITLSYRTQDWEKKHTNTARNGTQNVYFSGFLWNFIIQIYCVLKRDTHHSTSCTPDQKESVPVLCWTVLFILGNVCFALSSQTCTTYKYDILYADTDITSHANRRECVPLKS